MIEISAAVVIRENVAEGSLVVVNQVETLQPHARLPDGQEDLPATFAQMETKLDVMLDEIRGKALDAIRAHRRLIENGTHPHAS